MTRARGVIPQGRLAMGGSGTHGLSMWHWGPEDQRNRLVKVAVMREVDDDGTVTDNIAKVFGVDGRDFVVLEEKPGASSWRWTAGGSQGEGEVLFADGTRWELSRGGCGCGHPLKRLHPLRSRVKG